MKNVNFRICDITTNQLLKTKSAYEFKKLVFASPTLTRRHMDDMFDDDENHLISEEARSIIAPCEWSYVDGYIRWFFRVSHSYMVQAAPRDPPKPTHQKILEEIMHN